MRIPAGHGDSVLTFTAGVRAAGATGGGRPAPRTASRSSPSVLSTCQTVSGETGIPSPVRILAISVTDRSRARSSSTRWLNLGCLRGPLGPGVESTNS
jgi:hypothetical protein